MPPDFDGNIAASSAWMLFCSEPRRIEIVHRTNAPAVPSAPIEPPRAAIRKPGFASATTNPSHHVIALRSCRSSTWATDIDSLRPRPQWTNLPTLRCVCTNCVGQGQPASHDGHAWPDAVQPRERGLWAYLSSPGPEGATRTRWRTLHGREAVGRRAVLRARLRLGP